MITFCILLLEDSNKLLILLCILQQGFEGLSDDLHKLSDTWEFQENEIMNAKDRLRSIRAKLAVLEGKMALTIMYAQFLFIQRHAYFTLPLMMQSSYILQRCTKNG